MIIESTGMTRPVSTGPVTRTAAVGPRLQPEQSADDTEKLEKQRDTIQNQLTTIRGLTGQQEDETTAALENKLSGVKDQLAAAGTGKTGALERLQGKTDTYDGVAGASLVQESQSDSDAAEQTTTDTDDIDREIESLENEQRELSSEVDAAGKRGDEAAWQRLMDELKSVQAELQQKETESYRREHSTVFEN